MSSQRSEKKSQDSKEVISSLTSKQAIAYELMVSGENVFITGAGGVGKTALIKKYVKDYFSTKIMGVTSTTGVSALIFGGVTLHSYTGIGLGTASVSVLVEAIMKKTMMKRRWLALDTLIIDECSMLSPVLFDKLEEIGRIILGNDKPFGGIQIIASGDFLQLPCVDSDKMAFQSKTWNKVFKKTIYLTEIMRQVDVKFQTALNEIRMGVLSKATRELLRSRVVDEEAEDVTEPGLRIKPTRLFPKNKDVDRINEAELDRLAADGAEFKEYTREVEVKRGKNVPNPEYVRERFEKNTIVPAKLQLAVGAQVMLIWNLDITAGLVNGSRGVVIKFFDELPVVRFLPNSGALNGLEIVMDWNKWNVEEQGVVVLTALQIPLKVCYALSIHKCQGSTLDLVDVDLGEVFEYGQAYVSLSRAKTLEGLSISNLDFDLIVAHPMAVEYYKGLE